MKIKYPNYQLLQNAIQVKKSLEIACENCNKHENCNEDGTIDGEICEFYKSYSKMDEIINEFERINELEIKERERK